MRNKPATQHKKKFANKAKNSRQKNNQMLQQKKLPQTDFVITGITHDGRGVAVYGKDEISANESIEDHPIEKQGKKVFASFALPNEQVRVQLTNVRKNFEEGDTVNVILNPSDERQQPFCQHFGKCGGCSLQHWKPDGQIAFKQSVLAEHLLHQADIEPDNWLEPIIGDRVGYRSKARLGVRYITKSNKVVLGFRERSSNRLTHIQACPVLDDRVGLQLTNLAKLLASLTTVASITHIEVAVGQHLPNLADGDKSVAMIIRHVKPMPKTDINKLLEFFKQQNWQLFLQPKGINSLQRVFSNADNKPKSTLPQSSLYYQLPEFGLTYQFKPTDFTQVNMSVNEKMVAQACELLDLKEGEHVLDLFSGLGNFSLPMAKLVGGVDGTKGLVVGVEGIHKMTKRATDNAILNHLNNIKFYTHDLTQDLTQCDWANNSLNELNTFDALLIDPPRSGALEVMNYIAKFNAKRIVYVSCDPATLARDAKSLLANGYRLTHAGVMDMFCHTAHVESMLKFEKIDPV